MKNSIKKSLATMLQKRYGRNRLTANEVSYEIQDSASLVKSTCAENDMYTIGDVVEHLIMLRSNKNSSKDTIVFQNMSYRGEL